MVKRYTTSTFTSRVTSTMQKSTRSMILHPSTQKITLQTEENLVVSNYHNLEIGRVIAPISLNPPTLMH
jgi:hypothetical protein